MSLAVEAIAFEPEGGRLLTASDVARLLGMHVDWVYAQSRAERIPTVKLGRYRREAIEAWIREQER